MPTTLSAFVPDDINTTLLPSFAFFPGSPPSSRSASPPSLPKSSSREVVRHVLHRRRTYICLLGLTLWTVAAIKIYRARIRSGRTHAISAGIRDVESEYFGSPLTELGEEADRVFKLGSLDGVEYRTSLEAFIRRHFPPSDWAEDDPTSLLNDMRRFLSPSELPVPIPIPEIIWQTAPTKEYYASKSRYTRTFTSLNPGLNVTFHDDGAATEWVTTRFALADVEGEERGIVAAWNKLSTPAVMRSDTWRYLVLATEGGVYADTDVECLKPLSRWGSSPSWKANIPLGYQPPSLIVGVEADVGDRHDWHSWYSRPLQISQWTIASARGHPVLIDTLRRAVELAFAPDPSSPLPVMERTGPGVFTDAVVRYLKIQWGVNWPALRGLGPDGWRGFTNGKWGDTKVLSISGFSPGVGHMNDMGALSEAAMVKHGFAGSWRSQPGADV